MEEKLLVGLDFCWDYTQLTCYNAKTGEPESIGIRGSEEQYLIPTCLAVKRGSREWVFGEEAKQLVAIEEAIDSGDMLEKAEQGTETELYGVVFQPEDLLERYFRKVLLLLRQVYPNGRIASLVLSLEERDHTTGKKLQERLGIALARLGIEPSRVQIQSHMASFLHYTVSQRQDLWQNDTALFEFGRNGLHYVQLSINRKELPMIAGLEERDFSAYLTQEQVREEPVTAGKIFADVTEMAVYRKVLSTVYVVGRGFEGDWADEVLMSLCARRRVFKGQNLYAKGACYAALHLAEWEEERVLLLGEDRTSAELSMQVYKDGSIQEITLIRPAILWQDAFGEWDFILDGETELALQIRDYMTRKRDQRLIDLSGLPPRPPRMTRIRMRLQYLDLHTCLVQVRDMGFGEIMPASGEGNAMVKAGIADNRGSILAGGRIWEMTLEV